MSRITSLLNRRCIKVLAACAPVAIVGSSAFATGDGSTTLPSSGDMGTTLAAVVNPYINIALPIILGVFGIFFIIGLAMHWFKRASH